MERGLFDANLGGNLYKKRIAVPDQGKSSSWRVIVATKQESRWIFLHGFAKKDTANISEIQKQSLKKLAKVLLEAPDEVLEQMVLDGRIKRQESNDKS